VRARQLAAAALVCSVALVASSCLGSSFSYVSHRGGDGAIVYFKVPANWKVYNTDQVLTHLNGPLSPSEQKQVAQGAWLEELSAAPKPTLKAAATFGRRWPTAEVVVRPLSPTDMDTLSYRTMRAYLLGTDPLTASSGFQVLDYSPFVSSDGVRGVKLVVNITGVNPERTFGEVVEADRMGSWIYAIGVSCQVSCWGSNSRTIGQILSSWTVKQSP
jgi:hypothetical protein